MNWKIYVSVNLEEKKVFLAQKALYALYFNKDKWNIRNAVITDW